METKTLYGNKWITLKEIDGYVFSHEERCNGKIVSVLPYRTLPKLSEISSEEIAYLLREEVTPCWRGGNKVVSSITGGAEKTSKSLFEDACREVNEEAGYNVYEPEMVYLGQSFGMKSSDTVYHYFACDVTNMERKESIGDGSKLEAQESTFWCKDIDLAGACDPLLYVLHHRLNLWLRGKRWQL